MDGSVMVALSVLLAVLAVSGAQAQRRRVRRRNGQRSQQPSRFTATVIAVFAIVGLSCFLIVALVLVAS